MTEAIIIGILALAIGALAGWLIASRRGAALARDLAVATARSADFDIVRQARDAVERERNDAMQALAGLRAQVAALGAQAGAAADRAASVGEAHDAVTRERNDLARELARMRAQAEERDAAHTRAIAALNAQFAAAAEKALESAQARFLERADARFRQSEETAGQNLRSLLQPVSDRLTRYEEAVGKVETERKGAFSELRGQIEAMRVGQEKVSSEAAKLVNSLRNAPKARGRWGEQQLKNVLETCGLTEHTDFHTEVSMTLDDGARLRPDATIRIPGGKVLVIDAKVSLNAYQDAFNSVDEGERKLGLAAHAAAMRAHVGALGTKAYWSQFADAPEFVVMFVPGEHFLSAALEHDPTLWDHAFERRVLLASPTNLIAIARTIDGVWRQEKLAAQAREIGALGKELYARLATMGSHVTKLGRNLDTAMGAYNAFVGSLESQVLTSARRFEALNIDTGGKAIESPPVVEQAPRPLTKLTSEAAE